MPKFKKGDEIVVSSYSNNGNMGISCVAFWAKPFHVVSGTVWDRYIQVEGFDYWILPEAVSLYRGEVVENE
jgi:hypothetical protein